MYLLYAQDAVVCYYNAPVIYTLCRCMLLYMHIICLLYAQDAIVCYYNTPVICTRCMLLYMHNMQVYVIIMHNMQLYVIIMHLLYAGVCYYMPVICTISQDAGVYYYMHL